MVKFLVVGEVVSSMGVIWKWWGNVLGEVREDVFGVWGNVGVGVGKCLWGVVSVLGSGQCGKVWRGVGDGG